MKHLLLLALLILNANVQADQRFESWQGLCHFAYDVNDDDNEVYFANCKNTIDTHNTGDGNGRLAYGSSVVTETYSLHDLTIPKFNSGGLLKGTDADGTIYDDSYAISNAPCVMVTSNYDAGADDNNETVYVTNDWNLEIDMGAVGDGLITDVSFKLSCRGGVAQ